MFGADHAGQNDQSAGTTLFASPSNTYYCPRYIYAIAMESVNLSMWRYSARFEKGELFENTSLFERLSFFSPTAPVVQIKNAKTVCG
jgi:hypothetical protein